MVSVPAGPGCPHAAHRLHQHSGGQVSPPCRPGIEGLPQAPVPDPSPTSKTRPSPTPKTRPRPRPRPRPHTKPQSQAQTQTSVSGPDPEAHQGFLFPWLLEHFPQPPPYVPPAGQSTVWGSHGTGKGGGGGSGLGWELCCCCWGRKRGNVGLGDCLAPLQMLAPCNLASLHLLCAAAHNGLY